MSGATNAVGFWAGTGVISTKRFDYTLDYDIQVEAYLDNNAATDSVAAIELYNASTYNIAMMYTKGSGVQRATNIAGTQTVVSVSCVTAVAYAAATWQTFLFRIRAGIVQVFVNGQFCFAFTLGASNFNVRLMSYSRAQTDSPIIRFRNFQVNCYPVAIYEMLTYTSSAVGRCEWF